jgi:hypothetical protein
VLAMMPPPIKAAPIICCCAMSCKARQVQGHQLAGHHPMGPLSSKAQQKLVFKFRAVPKQPIVTDIGMVGRFPKKECTC